MTVSRRVLKGSLQLGLTPLREPGHEAKPDVYSCAGLSFCFDFLFVGVTVLLVKIQSSVLYS
jgi:hypothetical protein